ncbi:MAG: PIN domain-containing protein [Bacteroidetes bacterium]|nr:PIN domain-containing protein [Fibrella sp.]
METILVDTSVWIDWFNQKDTPQTDVLARYIPDDRVLAITPTILQEVLQGIGDDRKFDAVKTALLSLTLLNLDPAEAATGAAELYRTGRRKGITIRKPNDCLIAYYPISCRVSLLHNDDDFEKIALFSELRIFRP